MRTIKTGVNASLTTTWPSNQRVLIGSIINKCSYTFLIRKKKETKYIYSHWCTILILFVWFLLVKAVQYFRINYSKSFYETIERQTKNRSPCQDVTFFIICQNLLMLILIASCTWECIQKWLLDGNTNLIVHQIILHQFFAFVTLYLTAKERNRRALVTYISFFFYRLH